MGNISMVTTNTVAATVSGTLQANIRANMASVVEPRLASPPARGNQRGQTAPRWAISDERIVGQSVEEGHLQLFSRPIPKVKSPPKSWNKPPPVGVAVVKPVGLPLVVKEPPPGWAQATRDEVLANEAYVRVVPPKAKPGGHPLSPNGLAGTPLQTQQVGHVDNPPKVRIAPPRHAPPPLPASPRGTSEARPGQRVHGSLEDLLAVVNNILRGIRCQVELFSADHERANSDLDGVFPLAVVDIVEAIKRLCVLETVLCALHLWNAQLFYCRSG